MPTKDRTPVWLCVDEFRLLGPLEALVDGKPVRLAAAKPRALLALLLLHRNHVVPTERLIDGLWGDDPPARATKTLQVYISQLRKELGANRLVTRPPGYELRVLDGELDVDRFETQAAAAREALARGDAAAAADGLREALGLWRGPALREFRSEPFAEGAAHRLEEMRLAALEDCLYAQLEAGGAAAVIPDLETLVDAEPLRERPRELLMLALYRSGRQADALELYRRTRELYTRELGIEPGPSLRELERAMLLHDPSLQARRPQPTPPIPATPRPRRRRTLAILAGAGLLLAAALVTALFLRGGGSNSGSTAAPEDPQLRSFVYKLENFLAQSHDGRVEVKRAIAGALDCSVPAQVAAAQLDHVQRNRQSLLEQLAALQVPPGEAALRSSDLLQRASHASIKADWIYRDWLRARTSCPRASRAPAAARVADARATALKKRFLVAFDPLAEQFRRRVWRADEF
jgi:DNA-binding SARP family transcriptional activator